MNNTGEIIEAIVILLVVSAFLLNTGRALKAIELCKESLVLLNNDALNIKEQLGKLFFRGVYKTMFEAYSLVNDNTNAITYGKKLLVIYCECGETVQVGWLCIVLAAIYNTKDRYVEAKELYERAITIMTKNGNREGEQIAYGNLGTVYRYLGEYDKAKKYIKNALAISMEIGDKAGEATSYGNLGDVFQLLGDYVKAKEHLEKALSINLEIGNRKGEAANYANLGIVFKSLSKYVKAKEYLEKALAITTEIGDRAGQAADYGILGVVYRSLGDYVKAKEYYKKALTITMEIDDKAGEATNSGNLGAVFQFLGDYVRAKEYLEKALAISVEIGDKAGEAAHYGNLGNVFQSLSDYVKAKEYHKKALAIKMEIGDRAGEATEYGNLGNVFQFLGDFASAKEYIEKALAITMEIGDREGEATSFGKLGIVFQFLGEFVKAKKYLNKALAIKIEIGDRAGEAATYGHLGNVFQSLSDYDRAKEYLERALVITMKIGDRAGEAATYGKLGRVFQSLGDSVKAKEYHVKALAINIEIGNREGEGIQYGYLGNVFRSLGEYVKAKECHSKALAITVEIGDREGEATEYGDLGDVFQSVGEYVKAKECYEKALAIRIEIGDRAGGAIEYGNLGIVYQCFRKYGKSKEYIEKALGITIEIGDRAGEAAQYGNLGTLFQLLGNNVEAAEYQEKALAFTIKTGDRRREAVNYLRLGTVFQSLGEYVKAEEYLDNALSISKNTRDAETEFECYCFLTLTKLSQEKFQEAFSCLFRGIQKSEVLRGFNAVDDQMNISFSDMHVFPYKMLSGLLCEAGHFKSALYVAELGRARALADLMATQYSVLTPISANPQSWIGIANVITKESDCTCLYISYHAQRVLLWILKASGVISFREMTVDEMTLYKRLAKPAEDLHEFFDIMVTSFRSFGISPEEVCEDRCLYDIEANQADTSREESLGAFRHAKGEKDPESSLTVLYEMLIKPVYDLLEEPEIIIVPDRNLYRVPFAALLDENGRYLSESFRIRIVPSLATLKLIQESSVDYHSQAGALVVGDPDVGSVIYKGRLKNFLPLPGARKEAELVGRLLGVHPLLGRHATKQAVLQRLISVSLIHIAAHGNAERGEIAFAPPSSTTGIPQEGDFLLKMSEISEVQLRAKLVVLSCCHSGRGQIRSEGVVGIARAFLGSGARSVLVALWALGDIATEKFMNCFYEHLIRGESASESLHEAMKRMRENGFNKVSEWAPFMLIGDNVTFDVGTLKVSLK